MQNCCKRQRHVIYRGVVRGWYEGRRVRMTSKGMDFTGKPPKNVNIPPVSFHKEKMLENSHFCGFQAVNLNITFWSKVIFERISSRTRKTSTKNARKNQHEIFVLRGFLCSRDCIKIQKKIKLFKSYTFPFPFSKMHNIQNNTKYTYILHKYKCCFVFLEWAKKHRI